MCFVQRVGRFSCLNKIVCVLGTVTGQSATVMDYMATLADFAGISLPNDRQMDGMSLRNALVSGKEVKRLAITRDIYN